MIAGLLTEPEVAERLPVSLMFEAMAFGKAGSTLVKSPFSCGIRLGTWMNGLTRCPQLEKPSENGTNGCR